MADTVKCGRCDSYMTVDVIDGKKHWVCAECGYSFEYTGKKPLTMPPAWVFAVAAILGFFVYSVFE